MGDRLDVETQMTGGREVESILLVGRGAFNKRGHSSFVTSDRRSYKRKMCTGMIRPYTAMF